MSKMFYGTRTLRRLGLLGISVIGLVMVLNIISQRKELRRLTTYMGTIRRPDSFGSYEKNRTHELTFMVDNAGDHGEDEIVTEIPDKSRSSFYTEQPAFEDVMRERTKHVSTKCKSLGLENKNTLPKASNYIVVDEKFKVVYCMVPKIASTSWTKLFLSQHISTPYNNISWDTWHKTWRNYMPKLHEYPKNERIKILESYTKFMFVRHPLDRIVSAYKNKFTFEGKSNLKELQWYGNRYGKMIIKKYRENPTLRSLQDGLGVTFEEFIQYVAYDAPHKDEHWRSIFLLCHPCDITYDYIGNFYDATYESNFILDKIHIDSIRFPSENVLTKKVGHRFNTTKLKDIYGKVPSLTLSKLESLYETDYSLYNEDFYFQKVGCLP